MDNATWVGVEKEGKTHQRGFGSIDTKDISIE
jgi:hypothetical protein